MQTTSNTHIYIFSRAKVCFTHTHIYCTFACFTLHQHHQYHDHHTDTLLHACVVFVIDGLSHIHNMSSWQSFITLPWNLRRSPHPSSCEIMASRLSAGQQIVDILTLSRRVSHSSANRNSPSDNWMLTVSLYGLCLPHILNTCLTKTPLSLLPLPPAGHLFQQWFSTHDRTVIHHRVLDLSLILKDIRGAQSCHFGVYCTSHQPHWHEVTCGNMWFKGSLGSLGGGIGSPRGSDSQECGWWLTTGVQDLLKNKYIICEYF